MPPKKGKKKQVEDDWEAELGESLEAPAPPEDDAQAVESTQAQEDLDDGGLMGQLGKSKKVCEAYIY